MRNVGKRGQIPDSAIRLVLVLSWICAALLLATPVRYEQAGMTLVAATAMLSLMIALFVQETRNPSGEKLRRAVLPDFILILVVVEADRVLEQFASRPVAALGAVILLAVVAPTLLLVWPSSAVSQAFAKPLVRAAVASVAGTVGAFALFAIYPGIGIRQ